MLPNPLDTQHFFSWIASMRKTLRSITVLLLTFAVFVTNRPAKAVGTWTALTNKAPSNVELMLLLTDGTVMAANYGGSAWYKLTPDSTGSYLNGTWTTLASMHNTRLYYSSDVLRDGRVFVAGGEYGTGGALSEVYDPLTNTWTMTPTAPVSKFIDSVSETLPNGNVLVAPVSPSTASTLIYDIVANTWSAGPSVLHGQDEVAWVKLPDGSILTVDGQRTTTERYIPATNTWVADATVPVTLYDGNGETGPCFLLPNGKVFTVGGTGHTAIYTPSGTTSPGTWVAGPDVPSSGGMADAPGAMMVNGVILCATGPAGTLTSPVTFYEYDYVANAFTALNSPNGSATLGTVPFVCNMLALPDGNILFSSDSSQLYEYTPGTAALAAGVPTISSITGNSDGSFTLTGTLLNGISEGAAYGDDAQMASNYPIVRLTSGSGTVYFARTYNWSSTGVMTGATAETTQFRLPLGIPTGSYSVAVVVNGNPSSTVAMSVPFSGSDIAPTVATAAAASPSAVTTTSTNLSVLGADSDGGGESNLSYYWSITSAPSGVSTPSLSINGTNASKNTVATFHRAGTYTFGVQIVDASGLTASSSVTVTVSQTLASASISPGTASLTAGQTQQLSATGYDQFGVSMSSQPSFTWALVSGGGSVSTSGLYTTPSSGTLATVSATAGTIKATATMSVVSSPWISTDVGSTAIAGSAYDNTGTFTVLGEGSDIWGTADQFHYVYRSMSGDGMIIARVATQQNTAGWAKAGVMIRETTAAGSAHAMMVVTPSNGTALQWRATTGGSSSNSNTTGFVAPYWVKLVRSGNTLTGYRSANGTTWTQQSSATIPMAASVDVGLAVDSANTSTLNTSTFDNISLMIAGQDALTVNPGAQGTVNVLANDVGPSGATLTVTAVTQGSKGTVVNNGNGTVTYTASANLSGLDTFTYTVSDGIGDTATGTVVVTINGLQAHYPFSEGTGTTSADTTGSGYTATLQSTTWGTGISGSGLTFDGTASYATIPALNLNSNTVTITAWVNRNGAQSAFAGMIFNRAGTTVSGFHFGNASELRYTWNGAASTYNWNSGLIPPSGQWTFVALVITPTNATIYMMPLGGALSSATNSVSNAAQAFEGVTDFGQDPNGGRFFNGSMDEVQIFNTSLTYAQIAAVASQVSGDQAPTVATAAASSPNPVTAKTATLSVLGADDGGESNLTYTWAATVVPSGASAPTFSVNGTNAAKSTTATFSQAGTYTLTATITDAEGLSTTSSVSVTVSQTYTSTKISPSSVSLGSGATQQFNASSLDQFGKAMVSQPTFTWSKSGSGAVSTSGLYTALYTAGTATVTATSSSGSASANVTVTDAKPTVATAAGASPSPTTGISTNVSVLGADTDGGGESNLTYTWSSTSTPTPTFSVNGTNAAKQTVATFTKTGTYALKVTIADQGGSSTSSTVSVAVNSGLSSVNLTPSPTTVSSHGTLQFAATGYDQFGTSMSTQPTFTWSSTGVGSVSSSGLYTASYASGTATLTATSGTASGSANVTVTDAAPTIATAAAAAPSTVTGLTTILSVLGADSDGGGESNLSYTWTATTLPAGAAQPTFSANGTNASKNTTATFSKAGAYTLKATVTDMGTATVTSSVNVTVNQTLTAIVVTPGTPTVASHGTQQFSAVANDQFGNAMSTQPGMTWSSTGSGSIDGTGLYSAPYAVGTATVKATSGAVVGSTTVTVSNAAPTVATAAAANPSTVTGLTTTLSVLGADSDGGGESNLTYTWAATTVPGGVSAPTYTVNSTNTAKNTTVSFSGSGAYTFQVTITDSGGATVTSSVNVTVSLKPFVSWQIQKFGANAGNTAIAGDSADPDGDGICNLLEYAFNSDPLTPYTGTLPTVGSSGSSLTLTYLQNDSATDLTYTVESTADFVTWSPANPSLATVSDNGTTRVVKATVPQGAGTRLSLRLRVTRQ